jgi:hypothetical protein
MRSNNSRRIERLEKLLEASAEEAWQPINPDDLAILEEAEGMIGGPDDSGPPRGPEFFELAISRALEKRGRTTKEIAKELDRWLQDFEEAGGGDHT